MKIIAKEKNRLDKVITGYSRQKVQSWIKEGLVKVDGQVILKPNKIVKEGSKVDFFPPKTKQLDIKAEEIKLDIVHEDKDFLIINKPAGMVVHPAPGHKGGTLVNAILHHLGGKQREEAKRSPRLKKLTCLKGSLKSTLISKKDDPIRPGILHRLDKDTSGIIVVAKNDKAHACFSKQMEARTIEKTYITLVHGVVNHKGVVEAPIGRHHLRRQDMTVSTRGKEAVTEFEPIKLFENHTLLKVHIKTGRTHQIRVHLSKIDHPVVGDAKYGKKSADLDRQFLHAKSIRFEGLDRKMHSYTAETPTDLKDYLNQLQQA